MSTPSSDCAPRGIGAGLPSYPATRRGRLISTIG
jgi:hypothetical protein